ncbi:MAG: FAD:protein FMN transferase [Lachnospiraceae bacterium]|nr:FAD:protein FMN transferase [Lachnospiraceae bacterium]
MKFRIRLLLCLLLAGTLTGITGCTRNTEPITQTGFYFDTVIQITLYDTQDTTILDGCFALADTYENMLSATVEGSDLWRINHSNGAPVTVSKDTVSLLQTALYYARLTDGKVDPTIQPVSKLWHFGSDDTPCVPEAPDLEEALTHVSYQTVSIDGNTVTLADPKAAVNLGFIAKGYIADRMKEYLLEQGVQSACINLGGNVMLIGSKPDGSSFKVGIQKAFAEEGVTAAVIDVRDISVVTSGIYERYFYENDVLYHHILDTATGYPVENDITSVTILSPSSVDADALSTTCYCLGLEKGMEFMDAIENTEYMFLLKDGTRYVSDGFPVT